MVNENTCKREGQEGDRKLAIDLLRKLVRHEKDHPRLPPIDVLLLQDRLNGSIHSEGDMMFAKRGRRADRVERWLGKRAVEVLVRSGD